MAKFIYTYAYHEDERELCALEMRSLFGYDSEVNTIESGIEIAPSRSPFIKHRLTVIFEADGVEQLLEQVATFHEDEKTFKVVYIETKESTAVIKGGRDNRRAFERAFGLKIKGKPSLREPERLFGVMLVNGRWVFGIYVKSEPMWHRHQQKPHSYSTALSTRVARAVVNIAIPNPSGIKAIDPCCGIGTVLVEALSMGIDISGSDRNPLVVYKARENIEHFGLCGEVRLADIHDITNQYDVAIIDLPYNLCSVITPKEQLEMLESARRFSKKTVVVTVEPIDEILIAVGFAIIDRAVIKKGSFTREVIVCE